MSSTASADAVAVGPAERLEVLFEELAELTGQRNAIDGRVVQIVAEIDRDGLWGATGARSVPALVAWATGCSPANAHTIATVAGRGKGERGPMYDDHYVSLRRIHAIKSTSSVSSKASYQAGGSARTFATLGLWPIRGHAPPPPGRAARPGRGTATRFSPATMYRSPGKKALYSGRRGSC